LNIRITIAEDTRAVSVVLLEAANWLEERGIPLWRQQDLQPASLASDVAAGRYFLTEQAAEVIAAARFQLEDPDFWPDLPTLPASGL